MIIEFVVDVQIRGSDKSFELVCFSGFRHGKSSGIIFVIIKLRVLYKVRWLNVQNLRLCSLVKNGEFYVKDLIISDFISGVIL